MTDKLVVFSTCGSPEEAQSLARVLLEARLAACINIMPGVQSLFWWQGHIEQSGECLLVIKTSRELFESLRLRLGEAHSYDTPELLALPVVAGAPAYLAWLDAELSTPAQ